MDLAKIIIKLVNSNSKVVFDELPENDPLRRRPDISKIKKSFGWEPLIKLEEGLKLTADYFLKWIIYDKKSYYLKLLIVSLMYY